VPALMQRNAIEASGLPRLVGSLRQLLASEGPSCGRAENTISPRAPAAVQALDEVGSQQGEDSSPSASLGAERVIAGRLTLKDDQREMIRRLLTDLGRISVVIGEAGTGKTYAIVAAAQAWAREGVQLRAAAPTWRAANVMRAEGLAAQSTASLLAEPDRAGVGEGGAWLRPLGR
jgi:ATP-dependent exoDNAse (exonuclease V) alpha subunit